MFVRRCGPDPSTYLTCQAGRFPPSGPACFARFCTKKSSPLAARKNTVQPLGSGLGGRRAMTFHSTAPAPRPRRQRHEGELNDGIEVAKRPSTLAAEYALAQASCRPTLLPCQLFSTKADPSPGSRARSPESPNARSQRIVKGRENEPLRRRCGRSRVAVRTTN